MRKKLCRVSLSVIRFKGEVSWNGTTIAGTRATSWTVFDTAKVSWWTEKKIVCTWAGGTWATDTRKRIK